MTYEHILFDLDNTLYPGTSGIMQMFDMRIAEYVRNFLQLEEATARATQHTYYTRYGTTLRGLQNDYPEQVDVEAYLQYVHELDMDAFLTLDQELDRQLGQIRAHKAIFTNSPIEHAQRVLQALGIERHFKHIFDIRFHAFEPKPSIAAYHGVLEALDARGDQMIFVEDSPKNLVPARTLGMTTILISEQSSTTDRLHADYVVPDIFAALQIVRELEGTQPAANPS